MKKGTLPRLSVFRSNKHIYAQIIDDLSARTIVAASTLNVAFNKPGKTRNKGRKVEKAFEVGMDLAKAGLTKKIKKVLFDRGGYKYHGRVRALAEGARKGGLTF